MEPMLQDLQDCFAGRLALRLEPVAAGPGLTTELLQDLDEYPELRSDFGELERSSQGRRDEWAAGRRALLDLRRSFPEDHLSLTHNPHVAVGASCDTRVGVDVERGDREISEAVENRITREGEPAMAAVERWTVKEAAFKAVPQSKLMSEFEVRSFDGRQGTLGWDGDPNLELSFALSRGTLLGQPHCLAVVS